MSFKDLEAEIARWAELERFAAQRQAEVRARKEYKRLKNKRLALRGPAYRPERLPRYKKAVTLLVTPRVPLPAHRFRTRNEWADQSTTIVYEIEVLASVEAELQAIKMATACGYVWLKTLSVVELEL
jgi:hypothetical protein